MTSADWSILIPAVVGVLGALAAWLRAGAAQKSAAAAHEAIKRQTIGQGKTGSGM